MTTIRQYLVQLLPQGGVWVRMRQLLPCWLLAAMPLFISCGELFDVDETGGTVARKMSISRDSVFIMQGDSLRLTVTFSPETASNKGVLWLADQPSVVGFCSDTIVAKQPGNTFVTAMSADGLCLDTCVVNVMEPWVVNKNDFFFDTIVYADISVGDRKLGDGIMVGAFVGNELRGIAELRASNGISYAVIRVYGPVTASEQDIITFKCYDRREVLLRSFDVELPFDGESHGTLSNLVRLHLD